MEETTNENKPISEISAETKAAIKRKTAEPLPINPAAKGMKAEDIRRALYAAITDDEYSVIKELGRVISEANTAFAEIENKVDNLDTQISLPSWVGPEKPKYTASEVGAATPEDVSTAVAGEKGNRERADEALGGRIDTEASDRRSADEALGTRITNEENARSSAVSKLDGKISAEKSAREAADTSIRESVAANKSSIDVLNGGASTEGSVKKQIADAIAAIMENPDTSMNSIQELVDWVNNHASDALALSNKASANETAIGKINALLGTSLPATTNASTVIGYITEIADKLATETSERKAADSQLQKNIDAEASARATEISGERTQRMNMDNYIRENAVFGVELSGQDLVFRNDHGVELQNNRITLPSGSGDATGGSSDSSVATLPLQSLSYNNESYEFTKLTDNVYAAKLRFSVADVMCSYGADFHVARCKNFTEILPEISGRAQLHCQVSTIPLHPYVDSYGIEVGNYTHYPASAMAVECVPEKAMDIDSGYTALTGGLRFKPMDANYCYYIPGHEWYVELELNTEKNILIIKAFQCDNY